MHTGTKHFSSLSKHRHRVTLPATLLATVSDYYLFTNYSFILTAAAAAAKSLQSCPSLCDPIDGSPPGSPVPGILQAVTLEWVAVSFSGE